MSKKLKLNDIDVQISNVKSKIQDAKSNTDFSENTKNLFIVAYSNILGYLEERRVTIVDNIGRK